MESILLPDKLVYLFYLFSVYFNYAQIYSLVITK